MKAFISAKLRFLFPVVLVVAAKIAMASWILTRPFREGRGYQNVFLSWDSTGYLALARNWYPAWDTVWNQQLYAFLPGYPALIRITNYAFHNYFLAAAVPAFILGATSIVLFQLVAELYLPKKDAMITTMIFAFFPYVFVFTSVAYTESLFLFSTLACWLLHKKRHPYASACFGAIAALTRVYGILVVVPVAFDLIRTRRTKAILTLVLPAAGLLGWGYFCFRMTGDWLAPLTSQRLTWATRGWVETYLFPAFAGGSIPSMDAALIPFLAISGVLVLRTFKVDAALGVYSASLFALLVYTGNLSSMVRFISFIFPIWLTLPTKDSRVALACIPFFLTLSAALWYEFAMLLWVA